MSQTKIDLEVCVAACVLMEKGQNAYHVDISLDDFDLPAAKAVIGAAKELQTVDVLIVRKWAEDHQISTTCADVSGMLMVLPTSHNFMRYVVLLKREIYRLKIDNMRRDVQQKAKNCDLVQLSREIEAEESRLSQQYLEIEPDGSLATEAAALMNRIENGIDNADLTPTGWPMLDEMFAGGLLPNELVIIAARPSVGKTAAALQIAVDCGHKVCIFSLEMSKAQIAPRLLSSLALTNTKIATRKPSQVSSEIRRNLLAVSPDLIQVSERIVVIDNPDQTIESIRRQARREVEAGAKLVILDYLQLLDQKKAESRERAVSQISRDLKNMSKELSVPVICLAQMNRNAENEKRLPRLSDLRESGAIEQDANAVLFIHKTADLQDGKKQVVFLLAKGRDVGESYRKGIFNPDHQRFYAQEDR